MAEIKDGGPAFPVAALFSPYDGSGIMEGAPGMSQRAYFAGQVIGVALEFAVEHSRDASPVGMAAAIAVEAADALIAELAKEPEA